MSTPKARKYEEMSLDELFAEATSKVNWGTIDDLVACLQKTEAGQIFTQRIVEGRSDLATSAIKAIARQYVKRNVDNEGFPKMASIKKKDAEGKTVHIYKQESLFDFDDFRQVTAYWSGCAQKAVHMALGYAERAKKKFRKSIPLPFKRDDFSFD